MAMTNNAMRVTSNPHEKYSIAWWQFRYNVALQSVGEALL